MQVYLADSIFQNLFNKTTGIGMDMDIDKDMDRGRETNMDIDMDLDTDRDRDRDMDMDMNIDMSTSLSISWSMSLPREYEVLTEAHAYFPVALNCSRFSHPVFCPLPAPLLWPSPHPLPL